MMKTKLKLIYAGWRRKTKVPPWLLITTIAGAAITVYAYSLPPIHTIVTLIDTSGKVNLATNYPIQDPHRDLFNQIGTLLLFYPWFFWMIASFLKPLFDRIKDRD